MLTNTDVKNKKHVCAEETCRLFIKNVFKVIDIVIRIVVN